MNIPLKTARWLCLGLFLTVSAHSWASSPPPHQLLQEAWYLLESENFSFMSNIGEQDARSTVQELEQFRAVVLHVTGIQVPPARDNIRAIVFANATQFRRIAYNPEVAGYMRPSPRGDRLVTAGQSQGIDSRLVLFHEYVHYLLRSAADVNYPPWYDEGLADTLATVYVEGEKIIVGAPSPVRLQVLMNNPYAVGLSRVINLQDLHKVHSFQLGYYLSMSWALTHYLHTAHFAGGPNRLAQLEQYFRLRRSDGLSAEQFKQAFGMSPRQMQKKVLAHQKRTRQSVLALPRERFAYHGEIVRSAMSASEVAVELITQARLGDLTEAHRIADAALLHDPDNAHLLSAKGVTYQMAEQFVEAEPLLRAAYLRDPLDPILASNYAGLLVSQVQSSCRSTQQQACRLRLEQARQVYVEALRYTPGSTELRSAYGTLLLTRFGEFASALQHLRFALNEQRWDSSLHLRVGLAHHGLGQRDAAIKQLEQALHWADSEQKRRTASAVLLQLAGTDFAGTSGLSGAQRD